MNKINIIKAVIVLVLVLSFTGFGNNIKITEKNLTVKIDKGGDHIEGILEPDLQYDFILKDKGISINTFSGNAFVTALSYEKAESLKAKYGDFFKCDSPGVNEAIQNTQSIIFVTKNKDAAKNISKALQMLKNYDIPVVSFVGSKVYATKKTYFGIDSEDNTGTVIYYVKSFKILRKDYL